MPVLQSLCLLALLGLHLPSYASPPRCEKHCVRIGSWNIEWLGSSHRSQASDPAAIEAMAKLLADDLDMDLITLQEVNTQLEGQRQGETFSLVPWQQLQKSLQKRGYQTHTGVSGYAQQVVIAWRHPVAVKRLPTELGVPDQFDLGEFCRSSRLRKPLAGLFKAGQFDFWLVGVHLKSAAGQSNCSAAIRTQQAIDLKEEIRKKLRPIDTDVIIAGDFNASQTHTSLQALIQDNFHALHHRKLRHHESHSRSYQSENARKANSGSLVDHLFVSSQYTKEWLPFTAFIYKPEDPRAFARQYSDHLPLWVDFSTQQDDD